MRNAAPSIRTGVSSSKISAQPRGFGAFGAAPEISQADASPDWTGAA
jgi:hypothetical protein